MMDIQQVMQYLPQRYPFLMVDRVLEVEKGKRIVYPTKSGRERSCPCPRGSPRACERRRTSARMSQVVPWVSSHLCMNGTLASQRIEARKALQALNDVSGERAAVSGSRLPSSSPRAG